MPCGPGSGSYSANPSVQTGTGHQSRTRTPRHGGRLAHRQTAGNTATGTLCWSGHFQSRLYFLAQRAHGRPSLPN
eukprot:4974299-Lingulodinium_polyedra.AAC.1